jgi:hypothetical protein
MHHADALLRPGASLETASKPIFGPSRGLRAADWSVTTRVSHSYTLHIMGQQSQATH